MGWSPNRVKANTMKWHLRLLQFSHSIKYEEQTLVGWESGYHFARRKGNKSYKTGIKTCSFKIKWGGGWGVMVFNAKSNRECENMFRIYKEELSSIFLKFLKLYLVRIVLIKCLEFVTVVTSLTCLVLSHVMLKYVSSTNSYCCFTFQNNNSLS